MSMNHGGVMDTSFGGPDNASRYRPFVFWVNNDYDEPGSGSAPDRDVEKRAMPDCAYGQIRCQRNLEDFARLWVCGLPAFPLYGDYTISLGWRSVSGNPRIRLYGACESDGGIGYLTDTNVAATQVVAIWDGQTWSGHGQSLAEIALGQPYTQPAPVWAGTQHYLFEGSGIGSGELVLTVRQGTNVLAETSAWLDLRDVRDLYERVHVTGIGTGPPSTNTSFLVEEHVLPPNVSEARQLIMYVHGADNSVWSWLNKSDTMCKRLYWQGYEGRFASFRWPSPLMKAIPLNEDEISVLAYNQGEYIAWKSGAGLKDYIADLRDRLPSHTINLAPHSLGGIVVNGAIREGAVVDNCALMQAAVPAGAFDGDNANLCYAYLTNQESRKPTPDTDALGGYRNCFTNRCRRVNFYNDDDWALFRGVVAIGITLHIWEGNQRLFKPDHSVLLPGWSYRFDGTNCFFEWRDENGQVVASRTVTEDFEKKAFVARSRTKAVGAAGLKYEPFALTGGSVTNNVSLQDSSLGFVGGAVFADTRAEHSGQFTKTIQNATPFYRQLLTEGFLIAPRP